MQFKKIIGLLAAMTLVTGLTAGVGTKAFFTSSAKSQSNTFATGKLTLGGVFNNGNQKEKFQELVFDNMEPGSRYTQTTRLVNVGTLPMKIYRITGEDFTASPDDKLLYDKYVQVSIDFVNPDDNTIITHAYSGNLGNLTSTEGGYFNPIYHLQRDAKVDMRVTVTINHNADNTFQKHNATCTLNVFAEQDNKPNNGEPVGSYYQFKGPSNVQQGDLTFAVTGWDDGTYLNFQYNWTPLDQYEVYRNIGRNGTTVIDKGFELYDIHFKLASDNDINRVMDLGTGVITSFYNKENSLVWQIDGETNLKGFVDGDGWNVTDTKNDIKVDLDSNIIKVKKSTFPEGWKITEAKFGGIQRPGIEPAYTDWQQMSLNR